MTCERENQCSKETTQLLTQIAITYLIKASDKILVNNRIWMEKNI